MANKKKTTTEVVNNGGWSSAAPDEAKIPMHYMHVEIQFLEKALGTSPNSKDILGQYIASKAPDAPTMEEEVAALGENEVINQNTLIYPKGRFLVDEETGRFVDCDTDKNIFINPEVGNEDHHAEWGTLDDGETKGRGDFVHNIPYYYNYQIRGFFKDSCGLLARAEDSESSKLKAYKKTIDGGIFVYPRRIGIHIPEASIADDGVTVVPSYDEKGNLQTLSRSLRTSGPSGERVAIACSEVIPAGSSIRFTIGMTSLKFKPAVIEWLNYAVVHGISGWRNSGLGICRWREIQENYLPFDTNSETIHIEE